MNLETEAKRIWQSMTLWFNSTVLPLLWLAVNNAPYLMEQLPMMKPYVPDNLYTYLFMLAIVGNIALRFKTNSPVRL